MPWQQPPLPAMQVPRAAIAWSRVCLPAGQRRGISEGHEEETYEEFTERYVKFFQGVNDLFELQRGLNNCFAHDLVPSISIVTEALRACRRVNDYATSVRIFEGIKEKCENKQQVQQYYDELRPLREELGITLKE